MLGGVFLYKQSLIWIWMRIQMDRESSYQNWYIQMKYSIWIAFQMKNTKRNIWRNGIRIYRHCRTVRFVCENCKMKLSISLNYMGSIFILIINCIIQCYHAVDLFMFKKCYLAIIEKRKKTHTNLLAMFPTLVPSLKLNPMFAFDRMNSER